MPSTAVKPSECRSRGGYRLVSPTASTKTSTVQEAKGFGGPTQTVMRIMKLDLQVLQNQDSTVERARRY